MKRHIAYHFARFKKVAPPADKESAENLRYAFFLGAHAAAFSILSNKSINLQDLHDELISFQNELKNAAKTEARRKRK